MHLALIRSKGFGCRCRQAQLDALSVIAACAAPYGPALQPHFRALWDGLRSPMLGPAAPELLPSDRAAAQEVGKCRGCWSLW